MNITPKRLGLYTTMSVVSQIYIETLLYELDEIIALLELSALQRLGHRQLHQQAQNCPEQLQNEMICAQQVNEVSKMLARVACQAWPLHQTLHYVQPCF